MEGKGSGSLTRYYEKSIGHWPPSGRGTYALALCTNRKYTEFEERVFKAVHRRSSHRVIFDKHVCQLMTNDSSPQNSTGVVVVEFELSDLKYPFVKLSKEQECRVSLVKIFPRGPGKYTEYFSIHGADIESIRAIAESSELVEPNMVAEYNDTAVIEFVVSGFCPAADLCREGAIPQSLSSEDGEGHITAEIPQSNQPSIAIESFLDNHPSVRMVSKRTEDRLTPIFTRDEMEKTVDERLTDRQREVLELAFEEGYYDPTSSTTGEQLGEMLGISPATVSQHRRAAERKLIKILLQE